MIKNVSCKIMIFLFF